jgi:hypothetical protein
MAQVHKYLRLAYAAANACFLVELRVSTWLLRHTVDRGCQYYEGVASDGNGWIWLHRTGYCSRNNITFRTPHPSLEWSFHCNLQCLRNDVTWTYVAPCRAALTMSNVVAGDTLFQRTLLMK